MFEELKLDDLPLNLDYNQLSIMVFDSVRLSTTNADRIVTAHGWKGALNFAQARQQWHLLRDGPGWGQGQRFEVSGAQSEVRGGSYVRGACW